jgi:hypothetical protein
MTEGKLGLLPDLGGNTRLLRLMANSSYVKKHVVLQGMMHFKWVL